MSLADLRALARAHIAAAEPRTPGTREPQARGSVTGSPETQDNRHFPASVTRGTSGTRENDDAGRNERPATEAADLTAACEARAEALAGAHADIDVRADRAAIAAEEPSGTPPRVTAPPADMVEALAQALSRQPGHQITDPVKAMEYFRSEARRRLALTNDPMARGLLLGAERHRKRRTLDR